MPRRLKLPQIERKPKAVHVAASYRDTIGIQKRPDLLLALSKIRTAILTGDELPAGSYRRGLRSTPDKLLVAEGIMHLHFGNPKSRELLYLVQYPDHVVFLEISDHAPLTNKPPGAVLTRLHGPKLKALQQELAADAEVRKRQEMEKMASQLGLRLRKHTS